MWQPLLATRGSRVPEFEKLDIDVVRLAKPQSDVFGFPRYGSDAIVIRKIDAEIWAAVTANVRLLESIDKARSWRGCSNPGWTMSLAAPLCSAEGAQRLRMQTDVG